MSTNRYRLIQSDLEKNVLIECELLVRDILYVPYNMAHILWVISYGTFYMVGPYNMVQIAW